MTPEQRAIRDGVLRIARTFAIGGSAWDVERTTTNGVTGPSNSISTAPVTAYVNKETLTKLEQALAGAEVDTATWKVYAEEDQDIRQGDTLTSQEDATRRFLVRSLHADEGYIEGIVDPI